MTGEEKLNAAVAAALSCGIAPASVEMSAEDFVSLVADGYSTFGPTFMTQAGPMSVKVCDKLYSAVIVIATDGERWPFTVADLELGTYAVVS